MAEKLEVDRTIRFASKLNPADIDRSVIETVKRLPEGDKGEYVIGTILGKVRGVSFRNNPNDPLEPSVGLVGVFEGVPADAGKPVIQAPMCFLPKSVHEILVTLITEGIERPTAMPPRGKPINHRIDREVPIIFEVGARRSSSPIGYEFFTNQLLKSLNVQDTLSDLRDGSVKLSAPKRVALPAPVKRKGKRK